MWTLESSYQVSSEDLQKAQSALQALLDNSQLGFKEIDTFQLAIDQCQAQKDFFAGKYQLVIIGLGGSSLGAKALCESLYFNEWSTKVQFLDNVDAFTVDQFLKNIKTPEKVAWAICSKSGSTIEVLSLYDYCASAMNELNSFSIIQNTLVITEDKVSPLYDFAQKHACPRLDVPFNVGGRFSVFTPIGLFPLQFLGFNNQKALSGFSKVLENKDLVCELSAQLFASQQRQEYNFYSFQYCDRLTQWSLWLQQLWSESLAKADTRNEQTAPINSTFVPCRGSSDQHSVLQQVIAGHEKKIVCFHRVESSQQGQFQIAQSLVQNQLMEKRNLGELLRVEMEATVQAVQESGCETLVLTASQVDEESMAFLMELWMLTVGVMGELLDINAFDQPGVESGKKIARRVLGQSI